MGTLIDFDEPQGLCFEIKVTDAFSSMNFQI